MRLAAGHELDLQVRVAGALRARHPGVEVELVPGGQPHYPYILSLE